MKDEFSQNQKQQKHVRPDQSHKSRRSIIDLQKKIDVFQINKLNYLQMLTKDFVSNLRY